MNFSRRERGGSVSRARGAWPTRHAALAMASDRARIHERALEAGKALEGRRAALRDAVDVRLDRLSDAGTVGHRWAVSGSADPEGGRAALP